MVEKHKKFNIVGMCNVIYHVDKKKFLNICRIFWP